MRHFSWLVALLIATAAVAEEPHSEHVLIDSIVGQGGLVCDTREEVDTFITLIESGYDANAALHSIAGCGILMQPMLMRVVAVGVEKTEEASYLIVRYDFLGAPVPPQFGIGERKEHGTGL